MSLETASIAGNDGTCYHYLVANLSVRRIDDEVYRRLRVRAAEHGISMEEEVRRILSRAVAAPHRLGELAGRLFGSEHGVELEIPVRTSHDPLDLG
jgi:plasmid stability protein